MTKLKVINIDTSSKNYSNKRLLSHHGIFPLHSRAFNVESTIMIAIMIDFFFDWLAYILQCYFILTNKTCVMFSNCSCSPCTCDSQVHSQNEAIALKYLETLIFTKWFL